MLPARRAGVLAIAFVGLVAAVQAVPQNRVDDLVAKNLEARGGIDRLKDTFSIKQTATMTKRSARCSAGFDWCCITVPTASAFRE